MAIAFTSRLHLLLRKFWSALLSSTKLPRYKTKIQFTLDHFPFSSQPSPYLPLPPHSLFHVITFLLVSWIQDMNVTIMHSDSDVDFASISYSHFIHIIWYRYIIVWLDMVYEKPAYFIHTHIGLLYRINFNDNGACLLQYFVRQVCLL